MPWEALLRSSGADNLDISRNFSHTFKDNPDTKLDSHTDTSSGRITRSLSASRKRNASHPSWGDSPRRSLKLSHKSSLHFPSLYDHRSLKPEEIDSRLKNILTNLCPLLDRFGRVLTDLSPHLCMAGEENTIPAINIGTESIPTTIENISTSQSRSRSQIPLGAYRVPISRNRGVNLLGGGRAPTAALSGLSSILSELISGGSSAATRSSSQVHRLPSNHQVDIHIAILPPSVR